VLGGRKVGMTRHELSLYEYLHMGGNTQGLVRFTSYRAVPRPGER